MWDRGLSTSLQTERSLGGMQESTNQCFSPSLSPSLSLCVKINKIFFKKPLKNSFPSSSPPCRWAEAAAPQVSFFLYPPCLLRRAHPKEACTRLPPEQLSPGNPTDDNDHGWECNFENHQAIIIHLFSIWCYTAYSISESIHGPVSNVYSLPPRARNKVR